MEKHVSEPDLTHQKETTIERLSRLDRIIETPKQKFDSFYREELLKTVSSLINLHSLENKK
jgi:hypothetical protein